MWIGEQNLIPQVINHSRVFGKSRSTRRDICLDGGDVPMLIFCKINQKN